MAVEKDITMKQFNGTDYDTLYPKTTIDQVNISQDINDYYSLPTGSTFDDVLKKIPDSVGNIQYSVKTAAQMGDKYLPCDGSVLDAEAYPELADLLKEKKYPTAQSDFTRHTLSFDLSWVTESNPSVTGIAYINYINGYYIALVTVSAQASIYYNQFYYSQSLDTMFTHSDEAGGSFIKCVNGYIVNGTVGDTRFQCKVATNPAGPWSDGPLFDVTDFTLKYTQEGFTSVDLIYDGSKYVFGVLAHDDTSTDYYCLCTFSSLSNTTADGFYNTDFMYSQGFYPLYYQNGYYIFMNSRSQFIYSTTWNSGWASYTYYSAGNQYNAGIVYYKEKWYILSNNNAASKAMWISSTSAINSSYTATADALSENMYYSNSYHVDYDGLKLVCSYGDSGNSFVIAVFDDSANAVQTVVIPSLDGSSRGTIKAFADFFSAYYGVIVYVFQSDKFLPSIPSISEANAYIKALPGM